LEHHLGVALERRPGVDDRRQLVTLVTAMTQNRAIVDEARATLERLRDRDGEHEHNQASANRAYTHVLPPAPVMPEPVIENYEPPDPLTKWREEQDELTRGRERSKREMRRQEQQQMAARAAAAEDEIPRIIIDVVGAAFAEERKRHRRERDEALEPLRREIAELRGQVTALLTILGSSSSKPSKADVIDLPRPRSA
jgi:hypothetical protein